jgi:hypothetical protein
MANPLSKVMGTQKRGTDSTAGNQLTRAAKWGMREALKEVVREAVEESARETRTSRGGGTARGLTMLGLGAIAGYLARDWQLRPEMYEEVEEEIAGIPEEVGEVREEYVAEDESPSWTARVGRMLGFVALAGVGYAMIRRRRRQRQQGGQQQQQWTEERGPEAEGGLAGSTAETGGQQGSQEQGQMAGQEQTGSESEMGDESEMSDESSEDTEE